MQKQEIKYPSQFIKLPSKGLLYPIDSPYAAGQIQLRYPTAQDQNILMSKALIQKGTVIDVFIQSLIVNPAININQLVTGDFNALIVAARLLAYGPKYSPTIKCPSCGKSKQFTFDLNSVLNKQCDVSMIQQGVNQFHFKLPVSGANVVFKILTGLEETQIRNILKNQKQINGVDTQLTTRLRYQIISVNGKTQQLDIIKFIKTLPTMDSLPLRAQLRRVTPNVDLTVNYQCEACGFQQQIEMPLNPDFFYPSK